MKKKNAGRGKGGPVAERRVSVFGRRTSSERIQSVGCMPLVTRE